MALKRGTLGSGSMRVNAVCCYQCPTGGPHLRPLVNQGGRLSLGDCQHPAKETGPFTPKKYQKKVKMVLAKQEIHKEV